MFAQYILDCFPDCVAQYGLIGCGLSVVIAADIIAISAVLARRIIGAGV
jgi:hypothetical protein